MLQHLPQINYDTLSMWNYIWIVPSFHCCSNSEWKVFQPWNVQEIYFTVGGKTKSRSAIHNSNSFQWDTYKLPCVILLFWFNNFEFNFQPRIVFVTELWLQELLIYCPWMILISKYGSEGDIVAHIDRVLVWAIAL